MRSNYNKSLYNLYEETEHKNEILLITISDLKKENKNLKSQLMLEQKNKLKELEKIKKSYKEQIDLLNNQLNESHKEIERLKKELSNSNNEEKDYLIDKLNNQLNKDSSNSSIPTSKESIKNNIKRRTNTYNHRKPSDKNSGGQINHKGTTLTKEKLEKTIKENKIKTKKIIHYINGNKYKNRVTKYKIGIIVNTYVEKHIFIPNNESKALIPKDYYSDVTYLNDLKSLIVLLGNYFSLPYNKIKEFISDLTNNIVNLSEGTIDNFYNEFSNKCEDTLLNIVNNLKNGTFQHTDETVTKENGRDSYFRGYGNKSNVIFMYHNKKGDKPILEDGIITNYFGTIISDHDLGIFKYGTNNQDCVIHLGRYLKEQEQNIQSTVWQENLLKLLFKFENNRRILKKFGAKNFTKEDIEFMIKEYDDILNSASEENKSIDSTYWKEQAKKLLKRCIKFKNQILLFLYDFTIDFDNNFMERALRLIKGKTKISGGFRSYNGGVRFGNIMSIIKTSKLRNINPLDSIIDIMNNRCLFN